MPLCFKCRAAELNDIVPTFKAHFLRELAKKKGQVAGDKFQASYDQVEGKDINYCPNCYAYFKLIHGVHGLSYAEGPWKDLTEEVKKTEQKAPRLWRIGFGIFISLLCGLAMVVMAINSLSEWFGISVFLAVILTVIGTYGIPLPWYPILHWVIESEMPWGYVILWAIGWGTLVISFLKR